MWQDSGGRVPTPKHKFQGIKQVIVSDIMYKLLMNNLLKSLTENWQFRGS